MRSLVFLGIGLFIGFVAGFIVAREFGTTEPSDRHTLLGPRAASPDEDGNSADSSAEVDGARDSELDNPPVPGRGLDRFQTRELDHGKAKSEFGDEAAIVQLEYEDRSGRSHAKGFGLVIDARTHLVLVPLVDVRGSAFASAKVADNSARVVKIVGLREDLGLAILMLDRGDQTIMLAPQVAEPGDTLTGLEPSGSARRFEVLQRRFDEGLLVEVLDFDPGLPDRPMILVDAAGRAQAIAVSSSGRRCGLPVAGLSAEQFSGIDLTLAEYDRRFFAGSAKDLITQALLAIREGRFADAVAYWHRVFELEPFRRGDLIDELERAWRGLLAGATSEPRERMALLRRALVDLPEAGDLWFEYGSILRARQSFTEAIAAYENAAVYAPELVPDLLGLKGEIWYEEAQGLVQSGRIEEARNLIYAALAQVPGHVDLWLLQASLAERRRDYALAAESWRRAQGLDPNLGADLADAITLADSLTAAPGRLVIDYDPRQRSITVKVAINDRASGDFVIDTGATVSMVPDNVARAAGLDLSDRAPKIRLETAGSSRVLPYTPSGSLQVGSLRVEGLSVVVGNLSGGQTQGLLGMDFLQNFHLTNDTKNGRLVLSER